MTDSSITEKSCSKCREVKPLTEFPKDAGMRSGISSACRSCHRLKSQRLHQARKANPHPPVAQKRCPTCNVIKAADGFGREIAARSGLASRCKACCRVRQLEVAQTLIRKEKRCSACKSTKPIAEFHNNRTSRDGHDARCKTCTARTREHLSTRKIIPVSEKRCLGCKQTKPAGMFNNNRYRKDGLTEHCRECATHRRRISKFGLTAERFSAMKASQKGLCAACRRKPEPLHNTQEGLVIDHCHTSGRVRGLLCGQCNFAVGHLQDSPERAYALWQYLLKHRQLALVV